MSDVLSENIRNPRKISSYSQMIDLSSDRFVAYVNREFFSKNRLHLMGVAAMVLDKYGKKAYYLLEVGFSRKAAKQLENVPWYIEKKLLYWLDLVGEIGLREARKYQGFHDEPLKGKRQGQRSVRLSKGYRAIYRDQSCNGVDRIEIIEVTKHEY